MSRLTQTQRPAFVIPTLFFGAFVWALLIATPGSAAPDSLPYVIVGTGQTQCTDDWGRVITPRPGQQFTGQDAQHPGPQPAYRENGDGTVSDLNTGLMWVRARGSKVTWEAARASAATCTVGGYRDWRMPTIKELYSLINFNGGFAMSAANSTPFLDTRYFEFVYGKEAAGERAIDCQDWSATRYVSTTMNGNPTAFGVNFADGRIKGYPIVRPGPGGGVEHTLYVRYVRGNLDYGKNDFHDNGDGTVTDRATGLMWQQGDSGQALNWQQGLAYAQGLSLAGHSDWRVPNAKELQSLVDYTRSPATSNTAAIDPIFRVTNVESWYWTSTTHYDGPPDRAGGAAVYVSFGRAWGYMMGRWLDVHGAGAQRSDPKSGDPAAYPYGRGPQGDQIRIYNFVRCVRAAQ
jgi:hypothetical protein